MSRSSGLSEVDTVVFDKTGTLTQGAPQVVDFRLVDGDRERVLGMIAAVEARSEHPLAKAIAGIRLKPRHTEHRLTDDTADEHVGNFAAVAGKGVSRNRRRRDGVDRNAGVSG